MKNTYKILVSALAILSLSSCLKDINPTDVLTEDRKNEISQENPDKVFSATLTGVYTNIQQAVLSNLSHNYFGQKSFDYLTSLMGNDMVMTGRFAMSIYHYLMDYWQEDYAPTGNRWREYYDHIAAANTIIKAIDEQDPATTNAALSYLAQAKAIRGYAYLQLANLYQRCYYVGADGTKWGKGTKYDWSNEPLVPLLTELTEGDQPRSTVKEIYDVIISDLTSAIDIFAKIGATKTATQNDFDGCVASLYLARAYMNMHEWTKAIACAQTVMDNYGILTTEADILQGFSSLSLPDVVFGCPITADNSTIYMSFFSQMDMFGDGYAGIGVWRAGFKPFVDRIADTDIRLEWFLCDRSVSNVAFAGNKQVDYQSCKFIGCGRDNLVDDGSGKFVGTGWELGNYIYLRSEEAWFIKAEALAHNNDIPGAKTVLAEVMAPRQKGYELVTSDKAAVIEEINFQKRVEFWGEGIEFLDNRRLNIPLDRTDETWGAANNNHLDGGKIKLGVEELGFTYQIPKSEIENNKELTDADQNK
ncbi:MAG: RagB/SusD family nutrient uptake outer membrane protein [Bacteroidales bacterium]|nr:RagB/SusD family nutrient uptake outer membrane protein [Bacteroidales bacterium]